MKTWAKILLSAVVVGAAIQAIPFGHNRTNPPVTTEPQWNAAATRALMQRACFDCHSNATAWPWYAHVAPISWLVLRDVNDGRRHLNFSEWDHPQRHAKDVAREVQTGDMPLWFYLPMHPAARLTPAEKQALIAGATPSLGPQAAARR